MNFVRNCLYSWSERGVDLMKDENLSVFLSGVNMLEEEARFFSSGYRGRELDRASDMRLLGNLGNELTMYSSEE